MKLLPLLANLSLTSASRIMVPFYALFAAWVGYWYIASPDRRLRGASLAVARQWLPMWAWGMIAIGLAAAVLLAMIIDRPETIVLVLCIGCVIYCAWSGFYAAAIFKDPTASIVSPAWPLGLAVAVAHFASAVSISREEGRR